MSRTTEQERVASPVQHRVKFKGNEGVWSYWNKEEEKEVTLESLDFVVLDILSSISGWSDEHQKSIYSNLFKSTKDEVVVRYSDGKVALTGSYSEDKDEIKGLGGKFTASIFALAMIEGDYVPVRIDLSGGSMTNWIEFINEHGRTNIYSYIITGQKGEQQKKGAVKFYAPTFTFVEADEELANQADDFANDKLEPYINQ
jgi:hypothetical protein